MSRILIIEDEEAIAELEKKIIWSFPDLRWLFPTEETWGLRKH